MPLPDFPLEIWLNIVECACQDDGTTGVSLSSASQELRLLSKLHRYQSVQIKGWRQLLLFEEQFSLLSKDDRRLVNLFVGLESVFEAGYPNAPAWAPEDETDHSSYVPSDDESERFMDSDDASSSENEDGNSDERDSVYALEFGSLSRSEQLELDECLPDLGHPAEPYSQTPGPSDRHFDYTLNGPEERREYRLAEGYGYAALHRVLSACAGTLEIFTLCWQPIDYYAASQIFPVLPRLCSLMVWGNHQHRDLGPSWSYGEDPATPSVASTLFPALKRFEYSRPFGVAWFKTMPFAGLQLVHVSMPCSRISFAALSKHRHTVKKFRICCNCLPGECPMNRWPETPDIVRVESIDVKKEWLDQVARCDISPGFVEGRVPVMIIAWMLKDHLGYSSEYRDAVFLTDADRSIRLWDHVHRFESLNDTYSQLALEAYDPVQDAWYPVARRDTLGPIDKAGSALLLRSVGVTRMHNFECFRPLACSVSLTPWYRGMSSQ